MRKRLLGRKRNEETVEEPKFLKQSNLLDSTEKLEEYFDRMSSGRIPKKIFKYQLNGKEVKEYV
jgi:hypothetical protein